MTNFKTVSLALLLGIVAGIIFTTNILEDDIVLGKTAAKAIELCEADLPRRQRCVITAIEEQGK